MVLTFHVKEKLGEIAIFSSSRVELPPLFSVEQSNTMENFQRIVLASGSPYRRQLLQKLGIDFIWAAPAIDESPKNGETPTNLAKRLAEQKAIKLATTYPEHLIIGSDQIASFNGQIIGKPYTYEAAYRDLRNFSGNEVSFITGICLLNSKTGKAQVANEIYFVKFRQLTNSQIENYLKREQPYDCAGSFKAEGLGICLFENMKGNDPNTLIGLPLISLINMLANENVHPLGV